MECHQIQEWILDALDSDLSAGQRHRIAVHVSSCATCAWFSARQRTIDAALVSALPQPAFLVSRSALRARRRADALTARRDVLPDAVHFVSFALATLLLAWTLPLDPGVVAGGGATMALLSYVALSLIRSSFEDYPAEV